MESMSNRTSSLHLSNFATSSHLAFEVVVQVQGTRYRYEVLIKGIHPNEEERARASIAFIRAALQTVVLEMGNDAKKYQFTAVRRDGVYFKPFDWKQNSFPKSSTPTRRWVIQQQDRFANCYLECLERSLSPANEKSAEVSSSFSVSISAKDLEDSHAVRIMTKEIDVPHTKSYEKIWNQSIAKTESTSEISQAEQLLTKSSTVMLKRIFEIEEDLNREYSSEQRRLVYRRLQNQCDELYQRLEELPNSAKELGQLVSFSNWLFYREVQNKEPACIVSWEETSRYIDGSREEMATFIKDPTERAIFHSKFDILLDTHRNEQIRQGLENVAQEGTQEKKFTNIQKRALSYELRGLLPQEKQSSWAPFLAAQLLWDDLGLLVDQAEYVPAVMRLNLFSHLHALSQKSAHASLGFRKELLCEGLILQGHENANAYAFALLGSLPDDIEILQRCKWLDSAYLHFGELQRHAGNKELFLRVCSEISSEQRIQILIWNAFQV